MECGQKTCTYGSTDITEFLCRRRTCYIGILSGLWDIHTAIFTRWVLLFHPLIYALFFFWGGRSDLSLSATFHWPFSRDGQLIAIISYANDLSLVFSLILLLRSLPVGLLFHKLDPSSKLCCALSWISDFSLMFILPLHGYSGWRISVHMHYFHSHHSFMPCFTVHRHHFSLFFFFLFFLCFPFFLSFF